MVIVDDTDFAFAPLVLSRPDADSRYVLCLVKHTYRIDPVGTLEPLPKGEQFGPSPDTPYMDDLGRSLKYPSDIADYKPFTDVIVNATAYAPGGEAAQRVDVGVEVAGVRKRLAVFGDRRWVEGEDGVWFPSEPEPFTAMPVRWERSYGAVDDPRNPLGLGSGPDPGADLEEPTYSLPNVENPDALIRNPTDRPDPVGLQAIPEFWSPRTERYGTRDMFWAQFRAPLAPKDHNPRYYNCAPDDQQLTGLRGDEQLVFENLDAEQPWRILRLPGLRARAFHVPLSDTDRKLREIPLALDTLVVDMNEGLATLVWRGTLVDVYAAPEKDAAFFHVYKDNIEASTPLSAIQARFDEEIEKYEEVRAYENMSREDVMAQTFQPVMDQILSTLSEVGAGQELIDKFKAGSDPEEMFKMAETELENQDQILRDLLADIERKYDRGS